MIVILFLMAGAFCTGMAADNYVRGTHKAMTLVYALLALIAFFAYSQGINS